jgi:hypothetical protein
MLRQMTEMCICGVRGPEAVILTVKQMLCRLVFTVVILCILAGKTCADPQQGPMVMASDLFDLFTAEDLATITIDQTMYFSMPDGSDVVAAPGIYRILLDEERGLKFIPIKSDKVKEALLVQAVKTSHRDNIPAPVAVYLPDEENIPHIVLLLPGGTGLEAVGSFSEVRTRGTAPPLLSLEQVHNAVLEKLKKAKNAAPK